jgi:hypothetical protein
MKTHFDPYDDSWADNYPCGARVPEFTDYECSTTQWKHIDCKRCLKQKNKLVNWVEETEQNIAQQMQDQVDFDNETKACV